MREKNLVDGKVFTMGRLVHYVDAEGKQWPMIIIRCTKPKNGEHVPMVDGGLVFCTQGAVHEGLIPYSPLRLPHTWHWPNNQPDCKKKKGPQPGKPLVDPKKIAAKATP